MKEMFIITLISAIMFTAGCSDGPEPINYGTDQCSHCRMTIVDKKYGSELVTVKGKVFKFDAAECMVNYIKVKGTNENEYSNILVTEMTSPEKFIDAGTASFLISPKLRSPMGENISSFGDRNTADKYKSDYGGEIYDWNSLRQYMNAR